MRRSTPISRTVIALVATLGLAGCGTAGPGTDDGTVTVWALQDEQNEPVVRGAIDRYNKTASPKLKLSTFVNDAYKQKLQVSMGSPNAPDVFFNWGGGNLAQFVEAGQVHDLTGAASAVTDRFLPSVLAVGTINGKVYGLPMNGIQPVVLFYNKAVFAQHGLTPPKTYDELLALVDTLKGKGVTPIALAGTQGWTELMYLEYLLDRIGGPDKFAAIVDGKPGAWSDPAVLEALRMCQDLARRGAFGSNFASVNYDNDGASKLLATGKAAMMLMGTWEYATQLGTNREFGRNGMGYVPFPAVAGGKGDPRNVVGNPSNYFSVRAGTDRSKAAADFVVKTMGSDEYVKGLVDSGQVPAVKGMEKSLAGTPNAQFATFTYQLVSAAPSFTQSWDQALSPGVANNLNSNLQKLFLSRITPQQFATAMQSAS